MLNTAVLFVCQVRHSSREVLVRALAHGELSTWLTRRLCRAGRVTVHFGQNLWGAAYELLSRGLDCYRGSSAPWTTKTRTGRKAKYRLAAAYWKTASFIHSEANDLARSSNSFRRNWRQACREQFTHQGLSHIGALA